jgi:hypothetical protein
LNNALLVVDKVVTGPEVNLAIWRLLTGLAAMLVLLYGIIFDSE